MSPPILATALAPLPPLDLETKPSAFPSSFPAPNPDTPEVPIGNPDEALAQLETLGCHDVTPSPNEPDEVGEVETEMPEAPEVTHEEPKPTAEGRMCMRCEIPLRAKNGVKCPNKRCGAWYHVRCLGENGGFCMLPTCK